MQWNLKKKLDKKIFFQRDRNHKKEQNRFWSWRTQWMKWKNAIKNVSSGIEQMEDRVSKLEGRNDKITNYMKNKEKKWKTAKKAYMIYRIPSKGQIFK